MNSPAPIHGNDKPIPAPNYEWDDKYGIWRRTDGITDADVQEMLRRDTAELNRILNPPTGNRLINYE